MTLNETNDAYSEIIELRKMKLLYQSYIQSGGKITRLPKYKTSPQTPVAEPTKRGRGRPPKIVEIFLQNVRLGVRRLSRTDLGFEVLSQSVLLVIIKHISFLGNSSLPPLVGFSLHQPLIF